MVEPKIRLDVCPLGVDREVWLKARKLYLIAQWRLLMLYEAGVADSQSCAGRETPGESWMGEK